MVNNLLMKRYLHCTPFNIHEFSQQKLIDKALAFIIEENPQYSLAAWHMGGCTDFEDKMVIWMEKRITSRKIIKGIIKTLGLLYMIYKNTIEKMYAIGGTFETNAAMKWNPLLYDGYDLPKPPIKLKSNLTL